MTSYHNDESPEHRLKKHLPEKSSIENRKSGIKIKFYMAWYSFPGDALTAGFLGE
jgi:hypothetical protein